MLRVAYFVRFREERRSYCSRSIRQLTEIPQDSDRVDQAVARIEEEAMGWRSRVGVPFTEEELENDAVPTLWDCVTDSGGELLNTEEILSTTPFHRKDIDEATATDDGEPCVSIAVPCMGDVVSDDTAISNMAVRNIHVESDRVLCGVTSWSPLAQECQPGDLLVYDSNVANEVFDKPEVGTGNHSGMTPETNDAPQNGQTRPTLLELPVLRWYSREDAQAVITSQAVTMEQKILDQSPPIPECPLTTDTLFASLSAMSDFDITISSVNYSQFWHDCKCDLGMVTVSQTRPNEHDNHDNQPVKRALFDGFLRRIAPANFETCSSLVYKSVLKKNAACLLLIPVSPSLECDITSMLLPLANCIMPERIGVATNLLYEEQSGIWQMNLAPDIIRGDEAKRDSAHTKVEEGAQSIYQSIRAPFESLTALTINIPSLWSEDKLRKIIADYSHENWTPTVPNGNIQSSDSIVIDPIVEKKTDTSTQNVDQSQESKLATEKSGVRLEEGIIRHRRVRFVDEDNDITTEDLVDTFVRSEMTFTKDVEPPCTDNPAVLSRTPESLSTRIDCLARPAVWSLARNKLVRVESSSKVAPIKTITQEKVTAIIFQLQAKIQTMSVNASSFTHDEMMDTCSSFRHAVWIHLLIMMLTNVAKEENVEKINGVLMARILTSHAYQRAVGPMHWNELFQVHHKFGSSIRQPAAVLASMQIMHTSEPAEIRTTGQPGRKRRKTVVSEKNFTAVRVVCSLKFLERDELLDELHSEFAVSVIERDLQSPISLVIDEWNGLCLLCEETFTHESDMKEMTYKLAATQIQYQRLWIIIANVSVQNEDTIHMFHAALANFQVDVQTFTTNSTASSSRCIRSIIDMCADDALNNHRVLPRMWFERPYLLDDESQLERFLTTTQVVSSVGAQALLHRLSLEDLLIKSPEELQVLVHESVSDRQLKILWRMMHTHHSIQ